jgi:hypothetical protein
MSTKTLRKRIALVAVASLGFGLVSTVPASAGNVTAVTTASITGTGTTVVGTNGGSGRAITATVSTRGATVSLATLSLTVTGTGGTTGAATDYKVILTSESIAATYTKFSSKTAAYSGTNVTTAAFAAVTLDGLTGAGAAFAADGDVTQGTPDTIPATTTPTTYYLHIATGGVAAGTAFDDTAHVKITLTVQRTVGDAVTATLDNASTNIAGRVNNQVTITPTGDFGTHTPSSSTPPVFRVAAAITSQPTDSAAQPTLTTATSAPEASFVYADATDPGTTAYASFTSTEGTSSVPTSVNYSGLPLEAISGSDANLARLTFTPTLVGTYTIVVWNETSTSGTPALSGSESYKTFTVNVTSGISSMTLTPVNALAPISEDSSPANGDIGFYGSLIKVKLLDASGNPAALAAGEIVSIDPSGTGDVQVVNTSSEVASTAGAAYSLTAADFTNGVAYVNISNIVAEVVTVVATSGSVSATTTIEFVAYDTNGTVAPTALTTGWVANTAPAYTTGTVSAINYTMTAGTGMTATEYGPVRVYDESGYVTGQIAAAYDMAVLAAGTFTISASDPVAGGVFYEISTDATDATAVKASQTTIITTAARAVNATNSSVTPASAKVATAGSVALIALIKDQFGVAYASGRVTLSIAGRNAAQATQTGTTTSTGQVSFTVTDTALASSLLTTDTITLSAFDESGTPITETATIIWSTTAVNTVVMTAEDEDSTVAGTVTTDIAAGATGATGASSTVTATVKDAAGNLMAGVPVVFTVTGLTGAEVHTTKVTVYTGTNGIATSLVSSYAAGKATVTATAGGKSDSDSVYFKQKTATEVRTIAAVVSGRVITATATDRYGNAVEGVSLQASIDGNGFFGTGTNIASANTDKNGQVKFLLLEGNAAVKVTVTTSTALYGQTADAAAKVGTGIAATAVSAAVAGDALVNQKGLGAALAPAGINSVDVTVAADTATADAATNAADAAAEATDAANAATDAANAAAEAADAATAAAQDAADAVAALSTQVSEMVDALKKQITALTNLVIKIQKKVKA